MSRKFRPRKGYRISKHRRPKPSKKEVRDAINLFAPDDTWESKFKRGKSNGKAERENPEQAPDAPDSW